MDEVTVNIEAIKLIEARHSNGVLSDLAADIQTEGLRHPVTLWADGTLISGGRRVRAHFRPLMPQTIRAVFVDNIEDASKRLLADNQDERLSEPMKATDICRLWEVLKHLDGPAAAKRADEARRRGVELRRATMAGKRRKGRTTHRGDEYTLGVMAAPFGMSESTASRLWTLWQMSKAPGIEPVRQGLAKMALKSLDAGETTIWACYAAMTKGRSIPKKPKPPEPIKSAPAAKQIAAWDRVLPQMDGLVAGLIAQGPPNADLTPEQVGPACARLSVIRRDLEKIIKQMKEHTSK